MGYPSTAHPGFRFVGCIKLQVFVDVMTLDNGTSMTFKTIKPISRFQKFILNYKILYKPVMKIAK